MLNQDTSSDIKPKILPGHLSLGDHDYCSRTEDLPTQAEDTDTNCNTIIQGTSNCTSNDNKPNQVSTVIESEVLTSKTISNLQPNHSSTELNNLKLKRTNSDDNLSDSSSAISSSSGSDQGDLVIAQDLGVKSQPPNNTSIGQKRRPGRPPKRENDSPIQHTPIQARSKRVRQNVSVTDKSEWITGEDQIDSILSEHGEDEPLKRKRVISRDSDHLYDEDLSSDYSSSDAEQDDDSQEDEESEDDPDKLWCICRKPYDNKFMICCDVCKDWFHGTCVGVTKLMGDRWEREKIEWFCRECQDKMKSGIARDAIPKKSVKKEKKKKTKNATSSKRGRGRPRKSESSTRDMGTRSSARNSRKSLDSKLSMENGRLVRRGSTKPEARIETFDEFADSQRLKVLIKERKKEFFYKRQLAEQQKAVKRNELGLGKRTITADLGGSLDSLACSTNTPNMNNLPINIKSDHGKNRHKPPIVIQINTKKEPGSDPSTPKIVTAIVKPPKKLNSPDVANSSLNDLFTAEPIQISKKFKTHDDTSYQSIQSSNDSGLLASDKKSYSAASASTRIDKSSAGADRAVDQPVQKKKRKDSESSVSNGSNPAGSKLIRQKIKETLLARSNQIKDINVTEDKIEALSNEIENQLNECFKEGTQKYLNKFRSLMFNLRDNKNQCLVTNVLGGDITPSRLVRMSSDEMASNELAKWRERENKHSIELIKRDAQLAAQQVIVKKTHKGEEVISAPSLDDSATSETSTQEPPTTPTKSPKDSFKSKLILDGSGNISTTSPTIKLASDKNSPADHLVISPETSSTTTDETTKSTKGVVTVDDANSTSKSQSSIVKLMDQTNSSDIVAASAEQEKPEQGPKRFSVTIQSSLNPADLSRLREPLVKPIERKSTDDTIDNDSMTHSDHQTPNVSRDGGDHEDEDSHDDHKDNDDSDGLDDIDELEYDPEAMPPGLGNINPAKFDNETIPPGLNVANLTNNNVTKDSVNHVKDFIWSGMITMPEIAKFKSVAKTIDGEAQTMIKELSKELTVCGRIAPDQMQGYIKKLRTTTKNQILILQLFPQDPEDKASFNSFFDYLYSRNRYGVVQTNQQILKDFYILPLHERSSIPEVLKPLKNSSLDRRNNPNCLIGLLVKSKR